jgi:hypothetical protein
VPNQFAIYKALHAETCKVAGSKCTLALDGWNTGVWPTYLFLLGAAFAIFLYVRLGLLQKVGNFAKKRTHRFWLQNLIMITPFVLAYTSYDTIRNVWDYAQINGTGYFKGACPKSIIFDGKLPQCEVGVALWQSILIKYLQTLLFIIPLAALCTSALLLIFQFAPKRFWLLPAAAVSVLIFYQSAGFDRVNDSEPLPPDNILVRSVAPLAIREGWPLDNIHVTKQQFLSYYEHGRVVGLGSGQRIVFGVYYAFDDTEISDGLLRVKSQTNQNGFRPNKPSPAVLRAIMGHELAHVQRWHLELLLCLCLFSACTLCWITAKILEKSKMWSDGWTALPIYLAALLAVFPLHHAVARALSLASEYDADWAGLEISQEPDGFAEFAILDAAGSPFELSLFGRWFTYHPSYGERIRMAIKWQQINRPDRQLTVPDTIALIMPAKDPQTPKD